jgi:hypothetical protein
MYIDAEEPDRFSNYCPVCGKDGVVMPCFPCDDTCCPHCGSLILCIELDSGFKLLPDTPENRKEAEAVAAKLENVWKELRNRKRIIKSN